MFSSSAPKKKDQGLDLDPTVVIILCCAMGGAGLWKKNAHKIELFYFNHFEEIYLSLYVLALLLILLATVFFRKKTEKMSDRANLLSPLWDRSSSNIEVGKTQDGIDLYLSDKERCSHVQVIGTTGSGKSHSVVVPWTMRDLMRGSSVVIIDGKGSKDLPEDVFSLMDGYWMECEKLHFDLNNLETSLKINPLKYGSPQQITDRLFASFEFQDPYYRSLQYDICGYLVLLIHRLGETVTFKLLHELLTRDSSLSHYVSMLDEKDELKALFKDLLREPMKDRKAKYSGLISQLSPFAIGEVAGLVNADESELKKLLLDVDNTKCLIFSIPTLKYQKLGNQLGKLLLQELSWCVGEREKLEEKRFTSVFLDEFSEFAYEEFLSVLNKARSAKVGLHLCHQAISDLTKVSESFARGVNTNTNVKCILGLNDPETADFYARHFGTRTNAKLTEQVEEKGFFKRKVETGRGSMREVEEYRVHPNVLKELYEGNGVLHLPTRNGTVTERIKFKPMY